MSYEPTNWKAGDTITSTKLNKIEQGVASGGVLLVKATMDGPTITLNKTWKEIHDADFTVIFQEYGDSREFGYITAVFVDDSGKIPTYCVTTALPDYNGGSLTVEFFANTFFALSENGYPTHSFDEIPSGGELNPGDVIPENPGTAQAT